MSINLTNALSLSMLPRPWDRGFLDIQSIPLEEAIEIIELLYGGKVNSFIGHEDTANILSGMLGVEIPVNRDKAVLSRAYTMVAQYDGPRLPVGATTLPEGAKFEFFLVAQFEEDRISDLVLKK